ncbi:uncharacterized protein K460DRAFT_379166 [Cucurbitaria berberidis CBS 394.84]|uniref:Uncharacterized protein n=1 Tax=Cucurbitaria berberidis CBS 394.84 TaxID=1168544 RepID=A0A9P4L6P4_9PLEO|nr:uncharacterized protein K460DRAFT_379166 [Cucurbitaria berberidis CBS 394.84]KAF1844176.1 hypothetical protein K460DRAFT_379166 [Cucurbitaria berberidis CBS 394.84]
MPGQLRTRLRRVLTGSPDEGGPLSKFKARHAKSNLPESDFYLPGEKMPPLKYRRPVDPEHKKRLESFNFSTAWRRRSHTSLYSPMGSKLPSRRNSCRSRRSRSRSMHRSRRSSFSSEYDAEDWVDSGIGASIAGDERPANIREASDDEGDVLNVGLSRNPTEDPRDARRKQSTAARRESISRPGTGSDRTRNASQPFSPEELEQALAKSHLEATKEESDRSAAETPFGEFDDPSPFLRPRGGSIYVAYDGQGTPPKLPFWGTAYPSVNDELSSGHFSRRCSVVGLEDGACSPQFESRETVVLPIDAPGLTQARQASLLVTAEEPCVCPAPAEPPKRKAQPCAPCDAIAAILARPD